MDVDVIEYSALQTLLAQIVVDAEVSPSGILVFTRLNGETFSGGNVTGVWEDFPASSMNWEAPTLVLGNGHITMKSMKVGETADIDFRFFGGSTTGGNGVGPFTVNVPYQPKYTADIPGGIVLPGWWSSPDGSMPAFGRIQGVGAPGGLGQMSFYRFNGTVMQAVNSTHMGENTELKLCARYEINS